MATEDLNRKMATATEIKDKNHSDSPHDLLQKNQCHHCDVKEDVIPFYCTDCEFHICELCLTKHISDMKSHQFINLKEVVVRSCPKHHKKLLLCSCIPCELVICSTCKTEEHDTHDTEDIESALNKVVPDLEKAGELLKRQNILLIEATSQLQSKVKDIQAIPSAVMEQIVKEKDFMLKKLENDQKYLEECLRGFKKLEQEATNKAKQVEGNVAELMGRNEKMLNLITKLLDIRNIDVLFQVENEKVLDKISDLVNESREATEIVVFEDQHLKGPCFTPTAVECKNIIGTLEIAPGVQPTGDRQRTSPAGCEDQLLKGPSFTTTAVECTNMIGTIGIVTCEDQRQSIRVEPTCDKQITSPIKQYLNFCTFSLLCSILSVCVAFYIGYKIVDSQQKVNKTEQIVSCRQSNLALLRLAPVYQKEVFSFKVDCFRLTYYNNFLWCTDPTRNLTNVYDITDMSVSTIKYKENIYAISLHPFTADQALLAAGSGLYLINPLDGSVSEKLRDGVFVDLHVSENLIVGLQYSDSYYNVYVLDTTMPPILLNIFPVNISSALTVMIHNLYIYVSVGGDNASILKYTLKGDFLVRYGSKGHGKAGEMLRPILCAVDSDGNLLILDAGNNRLQVLDTLGQFSIVEGLHLDNDSNDLIIVGEYMFVLYHDNSIVKYKL